ncbi:GNAT family N-acetyltransferase [Lacticaseibacillus pantheris]|uniref:GNAT family N-acetyltransferase n=1 Tax=Lacticaseibacillus pantheris TaxID=171523 RepID=UPI0006D0A9A5|nr:GNAT family N-acetyltransferase [Lacticaseibacillus pantheris]
MTELQTGIRTARLTLRNFRPDDAEALFQLFREPDTLRFTRYNDVKLRGDFDQLFTDHFLNNPTAAAIELTTTGAVIGLIEMHTGGVLTYAVRQAFWNHGYVTEPAGRSWIPCSRRSPLRWSKVNLPTKTRRPVACWPS